MQFSLFFSCTFLLFTVCLGDDTIILHSHSKTLPITTEHFKLFEKALTNYRNSSRVDLCVTGFISLRRSTIDTMSYEFTIGGCRSRKCVNNEKTFVPETTCKDHKKYHIWIYESMYGDAIIHIIEPADEEVINGSITGEYQTSLITTESLTALENSLSHSQEHANFCKLRIISLHTQIVNGKNYKFNVEGCTNEACKGISELSTRDMCTTTNEYKIIVYKPIIGDAELVEFVTVTSSTEIYTPTLLKSNTVDFIRKAIISYATKRSIDICLIGIFSMRSKKVRGTVYEGKILVCMDNSCSTKPPLTKSLFSPADACETTKEYSIVVYKPLKGSTVVSSISPLV